MAFPLKVMIGLRPERSFVAVDIENQQAMLPFAPVDPCRRAELVARWGQLLRHVLPKVAVQHRWPITQDHCFMRVCLDTALGAPWHTIVKRPAIRHLSDDELAVAIAVAEGLMHEPETLDGLNQQSIRWRKKIRATA
jgi:hypothetical protein